MEELRRWWESGEDWRPDVPGAPSYRELRLMVGQERQRAHMLRRLLVRRIDEFLASAVDPTYLVELRERGLIE